MTLEFRDKWNTKIILTKERIKHIANHLEVHNKIHLIEATLKLPEIITQDLEREDIWYYQSYLRGEDLFLIIVVKRTEKESIIITIFKSKKGKEK